MDNIFLLFTQYGLLTVFVGVFLEQVGAPIPSFPFLLLSGMAATTDSLFAVKALFIATLASMLADMLWFFAGRLFGRKVLALLCRISISPDTCVRQSELSFARRGVATLVIGKFIPGLSTIAPPLAGALQMSIVSFTLFNLLGTLLWAGSGIIAGLIFHDQIRDLLKSLEDLGNIALFVIGGLLFLYIIGRIIRRWLAKRARARLPRVFPHELANMIAGETSVVILDVRSAEGLSPEEKRIPGARHIELSNIENIAVTDWPDDASIIAYCACPNDASAVKAALLLAKRGFNVRILVGGIEAWTQAGHPLEALQ